MLLTTQHELQLEASLLRTGWSLRRFYRGHGSLGQLWSRLLSAPFDSPIWKVLTDMRTVREDQQEADAIDETLALVDPRWADRDQINMSIRSQLGDDEEEAPDG